MPQKWRECMGCALVTDKVAQCLLKLQLHLQKVRLRHINCPSALFFVPGLAATDKGGRRSSPQEDSLPYSTIADGNMRTCSCFGPFS